MARGTFANIRLVNKFMKKPGPRTLYLPTGEEVYRKDPKILDKYIWANSADPDQTAPRGAV